MAHLIAAVSTPVSRVRAADGRPREEPLRVTIVREPWAAPFTAAELAAAVRLRLPRAAVTVAADPAPSGRAATAVTVRSLPGRSLRVERSDGDAVEFPLARADRAGVEVAQVVRRAALEIALFADQAAPPGAGLAVDVAPPPGEVPEGGRPPASVPVPPPAPPGQVAAPEPVAPGRWSLDAHLGPALAVETDEVHAAMALTVRARRYVSSSAAVELGAKLSGEYSDAVPSQSVGVADRAFFAGAAYEAWLSPRVAIDLSAALQYTIPVADIDGEGPVQSLHSPASSRWAVRTGVGVSWSPRPHLVLGVSAATAFSFREREFVDGSGAEVLGLGSMTLDLTAGAGVRW